MQRVGLVLEPWASQHVLRGFDFFAALYYIILCYVTLYYVIWHAQQI